MTSEASAEATLRLEQQDVHSLAELNSAFSRWIETIYHLRAHSSTKMSPHQRFTGGTHPLRHVKDPDKIDAFFYTRTDRVVRKTAPSPWTSVFISLLTYCLHATLGQ